MNIGINVSFLRKPATGIGQVTTHFLQELLWREWGNEVFAKHQFFLYAEEDFDLGKDVPKNFHKRVFLPPYTRDDLFRRLWWERFLLPRKIKDDQCDVFLSLYQSATTLPVGIKHVVLVHDIIPRLFPEYLDTWRKRYYQSLVEKSISQATKILSVSIRTEKDLIQHLGISPEIISVHHIDVDSIFSKPLADGRLYATLNKHSIKQGYIYYGGGLEKRKNVTSLLRAYKLLIEEAKRSHECKPPFLVISGKLMPELSPLITDVESEVKKLDLTPYVKILGFVDQKDLPALYKGASLFVFPSLYEGFGMPVLESMRMGVPVVTSKVSSLPEVGRDAVMYCHPEKPRDIADSIKRVLTNETLRKELVRRSKERVEQFSWKQFTEDVVHVLENVD